MVVGVFRGQILLWQGLPPVGLLQPDKHHLYNSSWTVSHLDSVKVVLWEVDLQIQTAMISTNQKQEINSMTDIFKEGR